jgi:hypothetical protein
MTATLTAATRSAATVSHNELTASARRRIDQLTATHGVDSPQVAAALARWGRILDTTTAADDTMALIDSLGSTR